MKDSTYSSKTEKKIYVNVYTYNPIRAKYRTLKPPMYWSNTVFSQNLVLNERHFITEKIV